MQEIWCLKFLKVTKSGRQFALGSQSKCWGNRSSVLVMYAYGNRQKGKDSNIVRPTIERE